MRRTLFILLLLLSVAVLVACGDDDDDDSTPEPADDPTPTAEISENGAAQAAPEATELVEVGVEPLDLPDNLMPDTFVDNVNARLFAFEGQADTPLTITMSATSPNLDPYLILMAADGTILTVDDDGAGVGVDASIQEFSVPEDSTYLLLATSTQGLFQLPAASATTGEINPESFNLVVDGIDGLTPAQPSTLGLEPIPAEGEIEIAISAEQPLVLLPMQLDAGQTLTLTTQSEEFADTLLYLFDPFGNRVVVNNGEGEDPSARIDAYPVTESGVYLVMATINGFNSAQGPFFSPATYTLVIE